jgi:DNA-binding NtrC family response regulator
LRKQIDDKPDDLRTFVGHIAAKVVGHEEAEKLTGEVLQHIHDSDSLGDDYPWPGNIRELEQCVRNVMIRKAYQPCRAMETTFGNVATYRASLRDILARGMSCGLTAEELESEYCRVAYAQTGDYKQTGEMLGLDWRTVKRRVMEAGNGAAPAERPKPR